jgi:hypothetical protein
MKTIKKLVAVGFLLGLGGVAMPACGSMASDACKAFCDCEGCNDNERKACSTEYEEARETAADYTCGSKFDDYAQCRLDRGVCEGGHYTTRGADCAGEGLILSQCEKDNSAILNR